MGLGGAPVILGAPRSVVRQPPQENKVRANRRATFGRDLMRNGSQTVDDPDRPHALRPTAYSEYRPHVLSLAHQMSLPPARIAMPKIHQPWPPSDTTCVPCRFTGIVSTRP